MLAYMSPNSLKKSIDTKTTWFYSRSRKELWNKGATSGNKQFIKEISYDCDSDALLVKVEQKGVACHTGQKSCFFNILDKLEVKDFQNKLNFQVIETDNAAILKEIYTVVKERIKNQDENSYTYRLHKTGINEILKKLGEEAIEIILSVKHQTKKRIISEIADLFYHLIVLLFEKNIKLEEIYSELASRRK